MIEKESPENYEKKKKVPPSTSHALMHLPSVDGFAVVIFIIFAAQSSSLQFSSPIATPKHLNICLK